jgi:hypothetical protein
MEIPIGGIKRLSRKLLCEAEGNRIFPLMHILYPFVPFILTFPLAILSCVLCWEISLML